MAIRRRKRRETLVAAGVVEVAVVTQDLIENPQRAGAAAARTEAAGAPLTNHESARRIKTRKRKIASTTKNQSETKKKTKAIRRNTIKTKRRRKKRETKRIKEASIRGAKTKRIRSAAKTNLIKETLVTQTTRIKDTLPMAHLHSPGSYQTFQV